MSDLPAPSTCANNLHRASERKGAPPEATELCVNDAGAFHMLDCPLAWSRRCAFYVEAVEPHPIASEVELIEARTRLTDDFLRWPYTRRVRALAVGPDALTGRVQVEPVPEPAEQVPESLAAIAEEDEEIDVPPREPAVRAPESYPGQRRSEDLRKGGARPVASSEAEAEEEEQESTPRTVEALFEELPEAPDVPLQRDQKPPRRRGRRRRRSGRRGPGKEDSGGQRSGSGQGRSPPPEPPRGG